MRLTFRYSCVCVSHIEIYQKKDSIIMHKCRVVLFSLTLRVNQHIDPYVNVATGEEDQDVRF